MSKLDKVLEKKREVTRVASEDCPICLDPIKMGLVTSCGHSFCGDCILEVWRMSRKSTATSCPYCRQKVTDMVPYLSEEERNTVEPREVELRSRMLEEAARFKRELQEAAEVSEEESRTMLDMWVDEVLSNDIDWESDLEERLWYLWSNRS